MGVVRSRLGWWGGEGVKHVYCHNVCLHNEKCCHNNDITSHFYCRHAVDRLLSLSQGQIHSHVTLWPCRHHNASQSSVSPDQGQEILTSGVCQLAQLEHEYIPSLSAAPLVAHKHICRLARLEHTYIPRG